jgi:hypothetical protein
LCALEQGGCIWHENRSLMPLHRFSYPERQGLALLAGLSPPRQHGLRQCSR